MIFRNDINGLRAFAVLPVIFFHAGIFGFDGGFLGVDVFFVISGFLITSNILKNLTEEKFSLISFYDRRARRILPALFFTMLVSFLLSIFFMLPYDLKNFGQSLVSTSLGANNVLLYLTSGYWSLASEYKPLYHTWSLGVEEQYYFVIPLICLLLFHKFKFLSYILICLCLFSFVFNYLCDNKEFNFLMIFTRFWELCIGSLLAFYLSKNNVKSHNLLPLIGLLLILSSYIAPGYFYNNQAIVALFPVVGTVLIILFTSQSSLLYKMLSQKHLMLIGLASYSIYLLHQPILSYVRLAHEGEVEPFKQLFFALFSIPLGYLSWRFIETPLRNPQVVTNKVFYTGITFLAALFVAMGVFLHKSYGMQEYEYFEKYSYGTNPQAYADRAYEYRKAEFISNNKKMLIIGNSFARDFYNALEENQVTKGYEVIYLPHFNENKALSRSLLQHSDVVFWVSSEGMANKYKDESIILNNAINIRKELKTYAKNTYFYVGNKNYGLNNNFVRQLDWKTSKDYLVDINKSNIIANRIESDVFGEYYIDLLSLFRIGDKTRLFTDNHKFISFDTDHITKDGAKYLGKSIVSQTNVQSVVL